MRIARLWPLGVVALAAATMARCSGSGGDGPPKLQRCEVDLKPYLGSGSGARAKVAADADLLAGEAASGRAGDVLLSNDRVRVLIEQANRSIGPQPYGGNIIDADVVRDGPAQDRFGELGALFQMGRTVDVERVEVLRDGAAGGAAIVAATGRDSELDFVNLPGMIQQYLPSLKLPDPDRDLKLRITTYYVLNPGSNAVHVVQGFCNDGEDTLALPVGDLIDSGGQVEIYGGRGGFGSTTAGFANMAQLAGGGPGEPFAAWIGEGVSYGYFPAEDMNQVITISGVTATLFGAKALLDWTAGEDAPPPQGAVMIEPKASAVVTRDFAIARDPGALYSHYYAIRGRDTGTVKGTVTSGGAPVANARVFARLGDQIASLFITDAEGRFEGLVPPGDLKLSADDGAGRSDEVGVTIAKGAAAQAALALEAPAKLTVRVRDEAGAKIPGKITLVCDGECAHERTGDVARRFYDVARDGMPKTSLGQTWDIVYVGTEAEATLTVPSGRYRVFVSRGPEWSLHEEAVELAGGGAATIEGRVAHVAPTPGWMSGDFHVHAINSPDSPIANLERLRTYLAEGVDVIVSTDHDYITDFGPWLAQIPDGAKHLKAITGVELTTFDYGHYNAFPLVADAKQRNGGAVDWAGGREAGLTPGEIFAKLHEFPGDQVVQLNHGRSGFFSALAVDTRTMWTRGDPAVYRIHDVPADAATGDTRLFDDRFTALEVQNGFGDAGFYKLMNDWMSLLSRGFRKTGTAVSDTHKRHGNSGYPRTYVRVGSDDPATVDVAKYASALNAQRAVGTNGPFVKLLAKAGANEAQPGDTLASGGAAVTLDVEVVSPAWLEVDEVFFYANAKNTETDEDGKVPDTLPAEAAKASLTTVTEQVGAHEVRRATASVQVPLAKDAWIIAVVRGKKDLFPVVGKGGVPALAFTNPVYVDADGGGWKAPIDLAAERARVKSLGTKTQPLRSSPVTEAELRHVLEGECGEH